MIKYKIIEKNETPELAKIEVSGFKNQITLGDTLDSIRQNKKGITEIEGTVKIKQAVIENILRNHPEVKNLDEETQLAVYMYCEADRFIKFANEKLAEFKVAQENLDEEVRQIELQTGIRSSVKNEIIKEVKSKIKNKSK
jgi:hypothetical protein